MDGLAGFDPPKMLKTRSRPDSESFEKSSTGRAWMGSPTGITWRRNLIRMSFDLFDSRIKSTCTGWTYWRLEAREHWKRFQSNTMVLLTENHIELLFMLLLYLSSGPLLPFFFHWIFHLLGMLLGQLFYLRYLGTDAVTKTDEFSENFETAIDPPLIFGTSCCKFLSISHRQKVHHIHIEIFANLQPEEIHFDSVSTNKTKWPRQVRELILDSDSEI